MISPSPSLAVQNTVLNEGIANDGSITETQIVNLKDGTFNGVTTADVKVNNLPDGLGFSVVQNDETTLTVTFTGNATVINSTSANASITVAGSKITGAKTNLTTDTFNIACPTNSTWATLDKNWLDIVFAEGDNINGITQDIGLIGVGPKDSVITWSSSDTTILSNEGIVTRPTFTNGDEVVTVTATITNGDTQVTKDFVITVKNYRLLMQRHLA